MIDSDAVTTIESALNLRLPVEYQSYVGVAFSKRAYSINETYDHPDEVIVNTLRRRFDKQWPNWKDSFVAIGDDGSGNYVFLDTSEQESLTLQLFSHDPPGIDSWGDARSWFLEQAERCQMLPCKLSRCDDRYAHPGSYVTRRLPPWKSIMCPITTSEWIQYIHSDADLSAGYEDEIVSGYSGIRHVWREQNWATWRDGRKPPIQYQYGALYIPNVELDVRSKMAQIADCLRAHVTET